MFGGLFLDDNSQLKCCSYIDNFIALPLFLYIVKVGACAPFIASAALCAGLCTKVVWMVLEFFPAVAFSTLNNFFF
jgi:hypothetical protein